MAANVATGHILRIPEEEVRFLEINRISRPFNERGVK
jgi:hypothetical protein